MTAEVKNAALEGASRRRKSSSLMFDISIGDNALAMLRAAHVEAK